MTKRVEVIEDRARDLAGNRQRERLFGKDFVLVCLVSLASYMGFQFLLPTLPLYMKSLGGQDSEIGLILGIYSISVLAARFVVGRSLDTRGGKSLLVIGAFLYLIAMLLYNVATTVPAILLLRLFHGLGFGMVTTAAWALAAHLAPASRRGEALGYFSNFSSVAMALGPGIALWIVSAAGLPLSGFPMLFAACVTVAVLGLLVAPFVSETRRLPEGELELAQTHTSGSLVSRDAIPFAIPMFFASFATGAIFSFVPIYLSTENSQNVSIFFFSYAIVMTVSRPFIGMLTDRVARHAVAIPLMAICAAGVGILSISPGLPVVIGSAIICGIGFGSLQPTLLALVVDLTHPRERGAALATFMSSIDIGIAVGSMVLGLVAQVAGYSSVFSISGIVIVLGLVYFVVYARSPPRRRAKADQLARPSAASGD